MKTMKARLLALAACAAMTIGLAAGCSPSDPAGSGGAVDTENPDLAAFPVSEETINLKVVLKTNPVNGDIESMWFWEEMERLSNIHFEVQAIDMATFHDRKALMIMSEQLPDMFLGYAEFDSGEVLKYGNEGVFIDLKDYVADMPNLQKVLATGGNNTLKTVTAPSGQIYSLPCFNTRGNPDTGTRAFINTQWLENLGLEMPTTLSELHDVLVAFRDRDPDGDGVNNTIPFSAVGWNFVELFKHAYGYVSDFDVKDGKISYFPLTPEYVDYYDTLNRFYTENLIDHEFYTQSDDQFKAKAQAMKVGMFVYSSIDIAVGDDEEKWSQYEAFMPVKADENTEATWSLLDGVYPHAAILTKANQHVEESLKFLDFLYTDTGTTMLRNGPEKGKWSGEGGWYYNENGEVEIEPSPEFTNSWEYINAVTPAINILPCWMPSATMEKGKGTPKDDYLTEQLARYEDVGRYILPEVMYTEEEAARINEIWPYLEAYVGGQVGNLIIGVKAVEEIPAMQEQMRKIGAEELLQIRQAAYDRYLNS